ncbi:hypothetical protein [Bradyrhizobium sp.]|uniref:hypothetical protein n=1 Tax=Bradyrhizobium sp. TaxID=376 RepID=UPI0025C4C6D3|nr:hypothetical protein [Bradyrhizobium sp.]
MRANYAVGDFGDDAVTIGTRTIDNRDHSTFFIDRTIDGFVDIHEHRLDGAERRRPRIAELFND